MLRSFFSVFLLRIFIVSGLMFKFLIHFEFIFMYGVKKGSYFIILNVAIQCFLKPLIEAMLI